MASDESLAVSTFDRVLFASSSGGTHGGLAAAARLTGFSGQVLGISIDEDLDSLRETVSRIATESVRMLGHGENIQSREVQANADYLGGGYGVLGDPEREAIALFARLEGILLDPVYTGRAAAGMIDLVRRGRIGRDETLLFWHTGGTPALWAYGRQLLD
jgi:1-aminocyclopropane-1-carboxylate deaminase/D-cysteine desulfhydrase-like pyridoxal-dependent ACC family enzyme